MESFDQTWDLICTYCRGYITNIAFDAWFSRLKPISFDFEKHTAIFEAPNDFHRRTLISCYTPLLNDAFISVFGSGVEFTITTPEENAHSNEEDIQKNYDHTFESFVIGSSNRFAHAASLAVATKPAMLYNPLFIYGNSGLGKTHLLYAISKKIKEDFPQMNILYIKGDEFTNELIEALLHGTMSAFREKYRHNDVLLVDDIQFIAGKTSTQEEFFHTFNTLYESKKQIILTSDRPPRDIATLEDRLQTRFEWGLMADIQPPDFETRIAIITRKAKSLDFVLPNNVCEYLANKLKNNIRQLEGAVKKLKAYSMLDGETINITTAQAAIIDIINNNQPPPVTVDNIIEEVARTYGVTADDIRSKKRNADISLARQISMYVIREITQMSMVAIGESFGGKDHSTVVYSIAQVEKNLKKNTKMKAMVEDIVKNIRDR